MFADLVMRLLATREAHARACACRYQELNEGGSCAVPSNKQEADVSAKEDQQFLKVFSNQSPNDVKKL